jgi:PIN domain nuclease of toxin-antitoxin system
VTGVLLDSHVALWLLSGEPVRQEAFDRIADPAVNVFLSIATPWELAIKQGRGRLRLQEDYLEILLAQDVRLLPIEPAHMRVVRDLPDHHRDPFDRMLVAQAHVERLALATRDERLRRYDVEVLVA